VGFPADWACLSISAGLRGAQECVEIICEYPGFDFARFATCLIFKSGEAVDAMSKELLTIEAMTDKVLGKIREREDGKVVSEISIYEIEGDRSNQNWGVTIVRARKDDPSAASRAAIAAILELGRRYDLLAYDCG
jgi:hypothetical protein